MHTALINSYDADQDLLRDRVILVTGAGDGIGKAAALSYAAHGATLILAGKTLAKLEEVYDQIAAADQPEPALYPIDFATATYEDYANLAERLQLEWPQLDGLLHNAGILGPRSPISSTGAEQWHQVMQVNLNAPFMLTKALLPMLSASSEASIIFTSSGVGRRARAYWGAYAVSKFGIEGLMQVVAEELEAISNIRVNSLNPGATDTAMRRAAYPAEEPNVNPSPADIMPAYLYLMGPDSKGVHGQALNAQ